MLSTVDSTSFSRLLEAYFLFLLLMTRMIYDQTVFMIKTTTMVMTTFIKSFVRSFVLSQRLISRQDNETDDDETVISTWWHSLSTQFYHLNNTSNVDLSCLFWLYCTWLSSILFCSNVMQMSWSTSENDHRSAPIIINILRHVCKNWILTIGRKMSPRPYKCNNLQRKLMCDVNCSRTCESDQT